MEQTVEYINPKEENIELWSLTVDSGLTPKTERYNREFLVKKEDSFKSVSPNEFIYNPMNMTLGAVDLNLMSKKVAVSGYYITMRTKEGYDNKYLAVWLKSPIAITMYKIYATGSLIEKQRVQFPTLSQIRTFVPTFAEQTKIGNFFFMLDNTIALHQEKLEALKKIKTAYLDNIFSQEIRFSGFCGTWEQRKLGEVAGSSFGGGTPSTANDEFWNGDIPWLQSSDLTEHDVMQVNLRKHITQKGLEGSAAKLVPAKSIAIVTRVGVGKLGIIPFQYTTSQDFLSLSNFNVDIWFGGYMIYNKLQKEVNSVQGTSIKGITKEELLNKTIKVPPTIPEQTAIGNFFRNIDDTIALHHQKIDSLHKLKHAYLQKMFS